MEMPSWVPDWRYKTSVAVDLSMRRMDGSQFFDTASGEPPLLIPTSNVRKLALKGFVVATVTRFCEVRRHLNFLDTHRMGAARFLPERFENGHWNQMYAQASARIKFPASGLRHSEGADPLTSLIWRKTSDDTLTDEQAVKMAYRRTVTADLYPRPWCPYFRLTEKEA